MNIYYVTVIFTMPLVSNTFHWNSQNKTITEKYKILAENQNHAVQIADNLSEKSFSGMIGYISYFIEQVD